MVSNRLLLNILTRNQYNWFYKIGAISSGFFVVTKLIGVAIFIFLYVACVGVDLIPDVHTVI